jgi:glycosyltransferase involved in cell wall biosynthesis
VKEGKNGFVVPIGAHEQLGQRIVEILSSGAAAGMGLESRLIAERYFGLRAMVSATEEIYTRYALGTA